MTISNEELSLLLQGLIAGFVFGAFLISLTK